MAAELKLLMTTMLPLTTSSPHPPWSPTLSPSTSASPFSSAGSDSLLMWNSSAAAAPQVGPSAIGLSTRVPTPDGLMAMTMTSPYYNVSTLMGDVEDAVRSEDADRFPAYMSLLMTLSCGLILIVGLIGNCLVPVVIWNNRDLRNSTNLFLLNLSLADILVLCVSMPTVLVEIHQTPEVWILGQVMCKSHHAFYLLLRKIVLVAMLLIYIMCCCCFVVFPEFSLQASYTFVFLNLLFLLIRISSLSITIASLYVTLRNGAIQFGLYVV